MTYPGGKFILPELPVRQYEDRDFMDAFKQKGGLEGGLYNE